MIECYVNRDPLAKILAEKCNSSLEKFIENPSAIHYEVLLKALLGYQAVAKSNKSAFLVCIQAE